MSTSSARPAALMGYSGAMYVEAETVLTKTHCAGALDAFMSSSGTFLYTDTQCVVLPDVQTQAETAVRLAEELDLWVGAVGQAFAVADGVGNASVTVDDSLVIANLPPGLADPPAEVRERVGDGQDLFAELQEACDENDHDRIEELLAQLESMQDDPAFMGGFAAAAEEALGNLDELEDMLKNGMRDRPRDGIIGGVIDFFDGAWTAIWDTLTFLEGLTTRLVYDPGAWGQNWGDLGSGLWHGITNPMEFLEAVIDWDGFLHNPAEYLGSFVPDLAATVFTGGAGAAARGTRLLDHLADGADNLADVRRLTLDFDLQDVSRALRDKLVDAGLPEDVAARIGDRMASGTQFNRDNWHRYPVNELRLESGRVLDSYDAVSGEIVSRKFTQFAEINIATARNYIREAVNKYSPGELIGDSPSVRVREDALGQPLVGQPLAGDVILEVPSQIAEVPRAVLDYATSQGVTIRTVEGVVLNP